MPVICIISCKILQDEIIWVLENDPNIDDVFVVKNGNHFEFVEKLGQRNISSTVLPLEKIPEICKDNKEADGPHTVIVDLLELALHSRPEVLKKEVYNTVESLYACSSGILLFYGLCGNVLGDIEKDFESRGTGCRVRILKDDTSRVVDDCIGATLGGAANYLKVLKSVSNVGTYLFTPMYALAWREILSIDRMHRNPEKALEMMKLTHEMVGYGRVAKINTGLEYTRDFDTNIEKFAELFGFEVMELEGTQEIFTRCYRQLKTEICS
ncbi:MAG: DUF1638 domain-containing protein [Methanosarcinaceae archaeon]|nr:DUF1638 domain-containing protein [Methanosarcinaceae archaeon]